MLVCDGGRLVGVITRKTLVREVVARGLDPRTTTLREIAEAPNATIDSDMPLDEAFALPRGAGLRARAGGRATASSSACSRARRCSGGSPRTIRRRSRTVSSRRRQRGRDLGASSVSSASRSCSRISSSTRRPSASNFSRRGRPRPRRRRRGRPSPRAPCGARPGPRRRRTAPALEPITATGFVAERVRRERARGPVERVLERARDRRVVLGRRDQDGVGRARPRRAERRDGRRRRLDVVVLVVRRHVAQPVPELELVARAEQLRRGPQEHGVVRVAAEAAGDGEDPHRYAAFTSERSALRVTSSARALRAVRHVGLFQVMPNCGAVDRRLELEAVALVAVGVGRGPDDRAGERRRAA